ncbi:hypothetical protein LTR28_011717 [Elasticomyces elasticus]|nr:hypothetical protein LTR28_011717 [Elasticomyces elasticus]
MAPMQAKVKSVLSGDTLVLQNKNDPAQERTLSLAFVSAPRIRKEGEEPSAFQSRDFLRRLCVGKVVQFNVLYQIPVGVKRDYGTVTLADGQQLPDLVVAEGWAKIRDDAGKKEDTEEGTTLLERLEALEAHAKADEKGVWGKDPKIEVVHEMSDAKAFAETWKGKSIDGMGSIPVGKSR